MIPHVEQGSLETTAANTRRAETSLIVRAAALGVCSICAGSCDARPEAPLTGLLALIATLMVVAAARRNRRMARELRANAVWLQSLRTYAQLAEVARDYLWTCDLEGRLTYVNQAVARSVGCDPGALIGRSGLDFLTTASGDNKLAAVIARLRRHEPVGPIVLEGVTPPCPRWVEVVLAGIYDDTGTLRAIQGISRDVTERLELERALRHSERRYRAIVELQRTLVSRLEPDGRLTFVNPAVCRLYGKTADELVGSSTFPLLHEQDMPQVDRAMRQVVAPPYHVTVELRVHGAAGTRTLALEGDAIRGRDGRVLEIQVVGRDVTDERRLEASSRHAGRFRILGTLAAGLAHEINNPAATILMQARQALTERDLLEKHPRLRAALEAIAREAKRCGHIANRILGLAIAKGSERRSIDLNDVVRAVAGDSRAYLTNRGVHLGVGLASDLPRVSADAVEIELLLANLIQNSVAAGSTPLAIWLRTARTDAGVQLVVEDNGPGIAPELRERVLDAGYTSNEGHATGLGLAFCREIAEAHGGQIQVTAAPKGGTTVRVDLPRAPARGPA